PEMAVEGGEPPVELLTQVADQRGVVRDRRLPPAVGDRLEQRNQRRRRGDDHILAERGLEQLRTLAESCGEELIARQEQHRELGAALELRPVLLGGELAHPRLELQLRLAAGERLDLGAESRKGLAALALEGLHLRLGALERGAQRLYQLLDGELALPERAGSHGLVASQRLAREAQEELAVRAQRLSRERVERGAQPRLGFLEELQAIGFIEGARLESHARGGELDPQRLDATRGAQL